MNPQQGNAQMTKWGPGATAGPRLEAPGFPPGYLMVQQQVFLTGAPAGYPMGTLPQAGLIMEAQFGFGQMAQTTGYSAQFAQQPLFESPALPQHQQQQPATDRGPSSRHVVASASAADGEKALPTPTQPATAAVPSKWAVPDNVVRKKAFQFSLLDRQRQGFLASAEMQAVLKRTDLPAPALAAIWCAHRE